MQSSKRFALQGVLATALGFFLLGGVEAHALNVTGILVNMVRASSSAYLCTLPCSIANIRAVLQDAKSV